MGNEAQLSDFARRLRGAATAADWSALGAIDHEVAQVLRRMRGTGSARERAALEELRRAHAEARDCCEREAARVGEVLQQMREHREGWMAYAMSAPEESDLKESRS